MKTEEAKVTYPRMRIAVLGYGNVGKSALTVRYLTKRFIGEYRSNTDLLYRQTITLNNISQEIEVFEVCCDNCDKCEDPRPKTRIPFFGSLTSRSSFDSTSSETSSDGAEGSTDRVGSSRTGVSDDDDDLSDVPEEPLYWADACVVTYSAIDRRSFKYAVTVLEKLATLRTRFPLPVVLVGNKADLEHTRQVPEIEGRTLSVQYNCQFYEVSVAENTASLYQAFEYLINKCRTMQNTGKTRKFSVSKMIGSLIGKPTTTTQQLPQGGTVVACQKSDLYKSRMLNRRPTHPVSASL